MIDLLNRPVIDKEDWNRMCAVPLTSYAQLWETHRQSTVSARTYAWSSPQKLNLMRLLVRSSNGPIGR